MPGTEGGQYASVSSIYDFTLAAFKSVTVQLGVSSVDLLLACVDPREGQALDRACNLWGRN